MYRKKCPIHVLFFHAFIFIFLVEVISTFSTETNCKQKSQVTICTDKKCPSHDLFFYAFIFQRVSQSPPPGYSQTAQPPMEKYKKNFIFLCSLNIDKRLPDKSGNNLGQNQGIKKCYFLQGIGRSYIISTFYHFSSSFWLFFSLSHGRFASLLFGGFLANLQPVQDSFILEGGEMLNLHHC